MNAFWKRKDLRRRRRSRPNGERLDRVEPLERRQVMTASSGDAERLAGPAVVVVDARAVAALSGQIDRFAAGIAGHSATVVVGADEQPFERVADVLGQLGGVESIHIISHGRPGSFDLGEASFSLESIDAFGDELRAWNRLAGPGSDLYLWACDVAGGDGAALVEAIHARSGFDVAASIDATGPGRLGGDLDLEYVLGEVASPRLTAGVDVLWEATLSDHTFTDESKQAVQDAFDRLADTIAPAVRTAVAGQTGSESLDPLAQRTIADLFTASSSISPADLESFLSLATTASAYLAGGSPTLSGLAAAINSALAEKASAAGATSPSITVTPTASDSAISLAVSITAAGSAWADVDQGTEEVPTPWGHAIRAMNSDYGATFRTAARVRAGSRLTTGFSVSVDLTDPDEPVPSITIGSTSLEAGVFDFGPSLRFGILDATIGGSESLPYATSLSFSGGATKTVVDWGTVGASASALASAASSTVDLPITAMLGGVNVAPGAAFRVAFTDPLGLLPPVVTGISLGRLPWFGNITSDDIIVGVKEVGGAYDTLGTTEALMASVPFVPRQSLGELFDFADLFDDAIGDVIDVTVEKTVGSGSSAQTILARPDDLQTLADFQAYPAFAGLGITPVYDDTAGTVALQFSASRTTPVTVAPEVAFNLAPLGALTFTGGTAPALSPTVGLGFGIQFEIGPGGPIVIGLGADPVASYRLSGDATFTVTPVGGSATTITVSKASTETNASLDDLIADVNAVLGGTPLLARESEFSPGIELYTPTVDSGMPIGITVAASRNQAALDLGFSDGIELSDDTKDMPISIFGRPSGVKSLVVPHSDSAKPFADSSFDWSLADLSGTVAYGINTIAFGNTAGSVTAGFSAVLGSAGATPDDLAIDPVGILSPQFTDSASLTLQNLSRVGGTNDIAANATIGIAVADFLADRIDSFVAFGAPLSVPGLEDSGRGTGRLSADAAVRFTIGSDTYEVTVTQAAAADNGNFQDLVSDFNVALSSARLVVNDTATGTIANLSGEVAFVGSGGRVSVMHTVGSVTYPVLENLLVANLAAGGTTTGRLASNSTLTLVRGADTYTVTVSASATADNTTFADLVADFNAALVTAQKQTGSTTATVDATDVLRFSTAFLAGRIQPEAVEEVANPGYAIVTLPPTADLGEIGYQAGLSVPNIASALTQASRVFDTIERDLAEFNATELPLLNQALGDLIELDAGLAGRIAAFGKLSASTPQELERALETSLGVPSSDLRITYDSGAKAYRIDFAYRASKATMIAFDVDLYTYYEQLGRVLPKGIDALTDGESKTPLSVAISSTSVLSVGYDLTTGKTFLYGHDGSASRGLTNGTSFTITFSVNGQNLEFPAKFGLDIRKGVARLENGSLAVTLAGPAGTSASSLFYVDPGAGQLAARDVANYRTAFGGGVSVKMPVFENFAPGTLTLESSQEAQESGIFGFIQDHPSSFYLAMPSLAAYLDTRGRIEQAQAAITSLLSRNQSVDADGISLDVWRDRLNLAAADLGGVLFAFAPELENARNVLGAEETLVDFLRDPGMILDKLNAAIGGVESALKGLDKIAMPFGGGDSIGLGGAVSSIFNWRTGWLLDMRNKMRNAGEGIFDAMREGVFEYLGPKNANILLKYDPVSLDRSLDSMTPATRPEDIGVVFMDKKRNVLTTEVRGADSFEIVFRLGQKLFDTGIDLGFQLDALESIGIGAAFDGGLRLQVGWEMLFGFGYSLTDGFYLKVDANQPEAQLRFDATLTGASKDYTQRWDAGGGYWKIVDTMGTAVTTDDQDVIDAVTGQPYRALAVNKFGTDVTAFVATDPAVADPCGCGEAPSATTLNEQVWWVVATRTDAGNYVPAELNDQSRYVPQSAPYPHSLVEVTAMAPAQLSGSLFFLRLAATDQIRRGLSGYTDVDSQYYYDGSDGPQTTAAQRDDAETGVNRNNELPTRFTASVGVNLVDPSASSRKNSVREDILAPAGHGTRRVVNEKGQDLPGTSGAVYKAGTLGWLLGGTVDREIEGVFAKQYYDLKLKIAPPAKYEPLDMPVRLATGANISLSGMGIIDGVQVRVGDRVLVKNQTIASQNGIYTVSPGNWSRAFDANDNLDFVGKPMFVLVTEGRSFKDTGWNLVDSTFTNGNVVLGTTPLVFERTMVSVRESLLGLTDVGRLKPYVPSVTLPLPASWVDQPLTEDILLNVEYDFVNYLVRLRKEDGILSGPAIRAAQLTQALGTAIKDANKNLRADAGEDSFNLAQAGFVFQLAASAKPKWYRIEFAHLVEDDLGFAKRKVERFGTFIDYGTPNVIGAIGGSLGWDPVADINADTTKNRITYPELRAAGKKVFALDYHATAVANLTMELSIGDTASSQNLVIPRIYADFNLDWSTRAARARIDKAKQDVKDKADSTSQSAPGSQDDDDYGDSLRSLFAEEDDTAAQTNTGADKGIDPASPLVKEMDLKPEIGFSNIRLDVGSFLTDFFKPIVDKAEPYLAEIRPILTFLNSPVPVLSDVAGRSIRVVDLLETFGGPKAKGIRGVIDTVTALDNLVAQIAALPDGVNIQIPMGRFWLPKVPDPDKGGYKYGSFVYDNVALGINTNDYTDADRDAQAALMALASLNPDSATQKDRQSGYTSNSARDRGGIRVPIIEDPGTLFKLMMGQTATLVTYQLPKLNYSLEKSIPLLRIVCFEVGLRASFELNSNLAFGFDTYGINQFMTSGDAADIAQGFYVSDRANADGTGADVAEFQAIVSLGLYGGVDLVAVKAGIEGGVRVVGEVNLNDPNNDGKLRLTEAIGLVVDTGNPLDLFDLSLRGEAYARYYYDVGFGLIKGGKDFARVTIFNLTHEGSDGTPVYASLIDGSEGAEQLPGTLLLHVGEAAAKRVSNTDPLKAKDGAEEYVIWNDSPGSGTVHVKYRNYSESTVRTYSGVQRVVFDGGVGNDILDASGLRGLPLTFSGGDGDDTLILGSGHAEIVSRLVGDDGNDTIRVIGDGIVEIIGGVGNDTLTGGTGIVRIEAGEGNDSITTSAGSFSTIVMGEDYGLDTAALAAAALENLLDFTRVASAIEFLLDGALGATVDGTATAGEENVLTFNVGGATEIRGSTQADSFTVRNPRTRNASRSGSGMSGLLLRGGQGDDLYDFTLDSVTNVASEGIVIDDVAAITPATAGAVTLCGPCNKVESIAVAGAGRGYSLPPQVVIVDPTGSGAQATATLDAEGRVTSIQVINGGSGYSNPQVMLVAPRSLGDKLVISSVRPAATLTDTDAIAGDGATLYGYNLDGKSVRFLGWGDAARPRGLDQSEIDSVAVNMPEGVLFLESRLNLFQTFTVDASRMVQNARIVADTVTIETDHGFQVNHPINTVNNGDVSIRVTGDGTATGEGDLNARRATAVANVSGGGVTGLTLTEAGDFYHFTPSITVGSDGATPGTGARFVPVISSGDGLTGFAQVAAGSGYYASPAPIVVIPPPASIQVDAMITSSLPHNPGQGDGRGRVLLYADTGMVSTSGEVFFPIDARPGTPQGSRTIDWIGGDFRYRSMVGLDDLVDPLEHPGISVGLGAEFTAVLDADGRVTGFTRVAGGSGYTRDLPPLVEIEGLATAVPVIDGDGSIAYLRMTYPGDGYGQPPRVTIKPNGFGRLVDSPGGATTRPNMQPTTTNTTSYDTPLNRVHIRSIGGTLVTVAGAGVGDPLKPIKSDVETFVAQVSEVGGGVHLLEKDGLRIGKDQSVSGITTVNGDVTITTFGGTLELGAPRQALDEAGRPLWQDAEKTIPIYDRDPETGRILYEGGDIATGSGDVKLTADDVEVNVDLNASGGSGTITLQPVRVDAEIGLAGTRARIEGVVTDGRLTGFDATKFWGGRGYTTAPLVIVDPAGQRAYASAVVEAGAVIAIDVIYGGTSYDPDDPPTVTLTGGGISGGTPANPATATAIVGEDGVITGFTITNPGSGYASAPSIAIASPGQALVQAILDTDNPDPVTGRFAVKEFVITNPGRNYRSAPFIEVAAPYDFTLDADEVQKFAESFAQVVIGRIEGQHLFHSPEAAFDGAVVLRAPRSGGTLDVASFNTSGPVSIVGSGNTFHFDGASPVLTGSSISIDDNVIVHAGVSGSATATTGSILVFGTGKGMIDGDPDGTDEGDDEDLLLAAETNVLVTGAIGSRHRLDDLTVTSATRDTIVLEQSVALTGDLAITGGAVTIQGVVDVAGDLVIDASMMVAFGSDVTVGGDLVITGATGLTFAGSLTVGGTVTLTGVTGTARFEDLLVVEDSLAITAADEIEFLGGILASGDVTLTADEVQFRGGIASVVGSAVGTLVVRPHTVARPIRVGTPMGTSFGSLDISDADLAAIATGWARVVIGDAAAGTGAVTIGSIGTQQGSRNSWIGNTTTIVGGSVTVAQKVDVAATAGSLQLVARTGDIAVNAAINETAAERNDWLRLEAAQGVSLAAPIWSTQTVSLVSGTTITQSDYAPIHSKGMRVSASGGATAVSSGNSFDTLAVETSSAAISIREDSGYAIGTVDGVSGITVGTATATLTSQGTVTQTEPISAGVLDLQGKAGNWVLNGANTVGTLTGDTGRIAYTESGAITLGALTLHATSGTALAVTAPGGITLGDDITTAGGDARFDHAVILAADVAIDVADASAVGTARFLSTIDATAPWQQGLAITGNLAADGSIGPVIALESIAVSGDSALAAGVSLRTTGDQTYSGAVTSPGEVTVRASTGGTVRFLGDVALGGLVAAQNYKSAYDVVLTGSTVAITEPVEFANVGSVTLGDEATDDLHFAGGVSAATAGGTSLAGTIRTTNSAAAFGRTSPNAGVVLTADTTVSTGAGAAMFAGTVDGASRLVVNAAGDTTFAAAVGGTTPLAHVETDAFGRTLVNGGAVTTGSPTSQVYNDPVLLGANTVFTAHAAGAISFVSTLDGGFAVTVNTQGLTTFGGTVGTTTPLASLTTDAGGTTAINGGSITTSGLAGQVFNDAVTLGNDATLTAASSGAVTFATTLDGAKTLAVNTQGLTTFGGAVGTATPLVSLTTDAGGTTAINGGSITTSGPAGQVFNDAVTLGNDATLFADNEGAVTFATTLDGAKTLAVNTQGLTTFGGAVGGTTALLSLTTDAGGTTAINGGPVVTRGAVGQVYNDAVTLGANTVLDATAGAITFATTIDGAKTLAVNTQGLTTFGGAVGTTTPLVSLTTDAGGTTAIDGGSIKTSGTAGQVFNDAVTLGNDATLSADNAGAVTFNETLDGAQTLAVNTSGATTFNKAVGGGTALVSLVTDAGGSTNITGGSITTSGSDGQVFNDAVNLGAATTLTANTKGAVTFNETLDGAQTLAVNTAGATTFNKAVGGGTALVSLVTHAGGTTAINCGSIKTSGSAGQVFNDAVTLGENTILSAANAGAVTFATTLDGAKTLAVNTQGLTTFGGAVGTMTPLVSLTTDAGGTTAINGGSITTSGSAGQVFNDAVTLGNDATLTADNAGAVTFATALDGGKTLAVNTQGLTTFGGAVGTTTPLVSLATDAGGATNINGGSITTSGVAGQVFNDAVEIGVTDATLAAGTGPVTFNGSVNSATGTARALTVNTSGTTTFAAAVGSTRALDSLATNAGGSTRISGGRNTTSGSAGQAYGDAVVLLTDTTLDAGAGAVTFNATVDGPGSLTVNTTGVTTFTSAVGGDTPLAAITTNAGGTSHVRGGLVRTTGSQSWLDDVTMPIDTLSQSVNGTIESGPANTFSAPGRAVTFSAGAGIGGANPLRIAAGSIVATVTGQTGGIALTGVGDLVINAGGLSANGPIVLDASGAIRVPTGGSIVNGPVSASKPIHWSVTTTEDAGVGSLREVIANANGVGNANAAGRDAVVVFDSLPAPAVFVLQAQLPTIAAGIEIDGTGAGVVLDGGRAVENGLTYGPLAAGSLLKGVTVANFTHFGIRLLAAPGVSIDGVTVRGLHTDTSMGLYATGDLTGTGVFSSTFTGGLRGALLDSARSLVFGQIGRGNLLADNRAAPGRPEFAGTGVRAQGNCSGTVVAGNTFTGNNYGFAFMAANNLRLERNAFARSSIAGIYIEGDSRGAVQSRNSFAKSRAERNRADVKRAKGSRFGGAAVVTTAQSPADVKKRK